MSWTVPSDSLKKKKKKKKKAPWKDGISNERIHHLRNVAKQKLLDIYNQSWNTGTFQTSWKEAIITPILKKGKDRHSKTSYCPISLLSCLGKTMERMVDRCLQHHLEKNGFLSPFLRKNRSTEDQVISSTLFIIFTDDICEQLSSHASIMDQSRASDHCSHHDAGSNESHLKLGKKVVGNDQQNQDWSHLLLPVSQERRVHPANEWTRNPPTRHPNIPRSEENWSGLPTSVPCTGKLSGKWQEQNGEPTWKSWPRFTLQLSDPTWSMSPMPGLQGLTWIS